MHESFLAREMLTMSNLRLVISIAQKYDNLGVELADLIQVMESVNSAAFAILTESVQSNHLLDTLGGFCVLETCSNVLRSNHILQGGLIGLLRGIEKFDASRGFRISTYVYWWIRQVRVLCYPVLRQMDGSSELQSEINSIDT